MRKVREGFGRRWRWIAAVVVVASAAAAPLALAQGAGDRAAAEAILADLDKDEAHKAVVADPSRRAHEALERATRMRAAGDEAHARLADGLARDWAEMARDLVKTADAEKRAADARRDALDAGALAERERALLEEGLARTGRLRAQIEEAEREAKETNRTAVQALDGGIMPKRPTRPAGSGAAVPPATADGGGGGGGGTSSGNALPPAAGAAADAGRGAR